MLGKFSYAPTDAGEQMLSTVSVSRPSLFSSLTLTLALGGEQVGSATVNAPEISDDTVFTFDPPITIPSGGEFLRAANRRWSFHWTATL
jgi:hypothetical protein